MNALILAAGLGTRLKPLTDTMPKAMVPVAGKPLIAHQIERLKKFGFNHLVVNVHHFASQIVDFIQDNDFDIDEFRVCEPSLNDIFVQYTEAGI